MRFLAIPSIAHRLDPSFDGFGVVEPHEIPEPPYARGPVLPVPEETAHA